MSLLGNQPEPESSARRWGRALFLLVLCLLTAWLAYLITRPFLKPIVAAMVLAIVYYPIHLRWLRVLRYPNLAALVSTLTVLLTLVIPFLMLGAAVRRELADLYQMLTVQTAQDGGWGPWLTHINERMTRWLSRYFAEAEFDLKKIVLERVRMASATLLQQAANVVGNIASFMVAGVIAFFTLFFVFRDGRDIFQRMAAVVPLRTGQMDRLRQEVSKTITASVYGGLAVALSQGILTGLAFWVLGLTSPILWGTAAALMSFVPLIGPTLIWGPAAIFLFVSGHWIKGVILLAWGAGVIGLADNVVRPYVISEQVKFYPLYVFIALLGGAQAFGVLGLFIGPVVLAVAQALFTLIREESRLQREN